jgi:type II secretory pathway pseudopilin PulG
MAFINFDCPECGHNLEVDERGAGFIVKCPECQEPIQIPDMPMDSGDSDSSRVRTIVAIAVAVLLAAAAAWGFVSSRSAKARAEAAEAEAASLRDQLDEANDRIEVQLQTQQIQHRSETREQMDALDTLARRIFDQATANLRALDDTERRLIEESRRDQDSIVRADIKARLEDARDALPQAPVMGDAEAGRGLQNSGSTLVFPVLLGANGKPLRENAEITAIEGDQVSVRFGGGTASYRLYELHPGVVSYLPAVDPLLLVPPAKRKAEALRLHQLQCARRAEEFAKLGDELDAALHAAP